MNVLIVDAHSIGYTQQEAKKGLKTGDQVTSAIFGFLEFIHEAAKERVYDRIEVLWDGKTSWRNNFYPAYKAQRSADPKTQAMREEFRSQIPIIKEMLWICGVDQLHSPIAEADDLGGVRVRDVYGPNDRVELATGDRDWLQFVSDTVSWYSPRLKTRVNKANFEVATGVSTPSQFIQAKALQGDTSDNIPGVGKIGEKGAIDILNEYGSVPAFILATRAKIAEMEPDKKGKYKGIDQAHSKLALNMPSDKEPELGRIDVFKRNLELMTLGTAVVSDVKQLPGAYNEQFLIQFCQRWAFLSMLEDVHALVSPFRDLAASGQKFRTAT